MSLRTKKPEYEIAECAPDGNGPRPVVLMPKTVTRCGAMKVDTLYTNPNRRCNRSLYYPQLNVATGEAFGTIGTWHAYYGLVCPVCCSKNERLWRDLISRFPTFSLLVGDPYDPDLEMDSNARARAVARVRHALTDNLPTAKVGGLRRMDGSGDGATW